MMQIRSVVDQETGDRSLPVHYYLIERAGFVSCFSLKRVDTCALAVPESPRQVSVALVPMLDENGLTLTPAARPRHASKTSMSCGR